MRVVDFVLGAAAHAVVGAMTRRRRAGAGDEDDARGDEAVRREREQRLAERSGRTRAERALRAAKRELEAMRATVKSVSGDAREGGGDAAGASAVPSHRVKYSEPMPSFVIAFRIHCHCLMIRSSPVDTAFQLGAPKSSMLCACPCITL